FLFLALALLRLFLFVRFFLFYSYGHPRDLHSFPTRRSSDLRILQSHFAARVGHDALPAAPAGGRARGRRRRPLPGGGTGFGQPRSEEHTSELQSRFDLVCRLLLEKKKKHNSNTVPKHNASE